MTAVRRVFAVLGLALAVVVGSSIPASATFTDRASVPTMTLGTATVAAPGNVVGKLTCGDSNSTMNVTWTPSGSARVTGYTVTVHFSDGYQQTETVTGASASSWSKSITTYNVTAFAIRYSVTTQTNYGWYTQSGLTGSFRC
jgi:hypothetical protein